MVSKDKWTKAYVDESNYKNLIFSEVGRGEPEYFVVYNPTLKVIKLLI